MTGIVVADQDRELTVAVVYPADRNPALVYLATLRSENSRRVMRHSLRRVLTILLNCELDDIPDSDLVIERFGWYNLRYQHIAAIRSRLIEILSSAAVNRHLSALRGVMKECWRLEYIDVETYRRAVDVQNVKYEVIPAGRDLPEREFRLMLLQCYEDGIAGVRDLAIIGLLATTGLRRSELAKLDIADFDPKSGRLNVLYGKGGKQRTVYAQNRALDVLREWLRVRGDDPGAMFTSILKGGKVTMRRYPASTIHKMIGDRAVRAGIAKVTPHDLRRKFVSDMLDKNIDMVMISQITGHKDPRMLLRYDRRTEESKRQAVAKIDLPI